MICNSIGNKKFQKHLSVDAPRNQQMTSHYTFYTEWQDEDSGKVDGQCSARSVGRTSLEQNATNISMA